MLLTVNKVNETLSGVIGGKNYSISYSEAVHTKLTDLEDKFDKAETLEEAKGLIEEAQSVIENGVEADVLKAYGEYLKHDPKNDRFYLHSNGKTSSIPLPKVLVDKLIEAMDKDLSTLPFIKAWMWFLKNPLFSPSKAKYFAKYITTTFLDQELYTAKIEEGYSHEKATELATYNDVAITKNGLIATYKYARVKYTKFDPKTGEVVNRYEEVFDEETGEKTIKMPDHAEDYELIPPIMGEDGDAFGCDGIKGHRIRIGAIHALDSFDQINTRDGSFGGGGLHVGGRKYIQGYGGHERLLLSAFVNPMHIGGFTDGGDGAMRVKEYFVHSAEFAPMKSFYNESGYLAHSNAQWKEMLAEAITASEEKIANIKNAVSELEAL